MLLTNTAIQKKTTAKCKGRFYKPAFVFLKLPHMEDLKANAQSLKTHVGDYVKTYIELTKAKATQGASNAASALTILIGVLFFGLFFFQFVFLGLAWSIGSLLNSNAAGFFIVAGFFLLIIILLFALRKKYINPLIRNAIVRIVYEQKKEEHAADKN